MDGRKRTLVLIALCIFALGAHAQAVRKFDIPVTIQLINNTDDIVLVYLSSPVHDDYKVEYPRKTVCTAKDLTKVRMMMPNIPNLLLTFELENPYRFSGGGFGGNSFDKVMTIAVTPGKPGEYVYTIVKK